MDRRLAPYARAGACLAVIVLVVVGVRAAITRHTPAPVAADVPTKTQAAPEASEDPPVDPRLPRELEIAVGRAAMAEGDAPGTDSKVAPRPPGSTRLLDSSLDGNGSRIRIYRTPEAADIVADRLSKGIIANGFAARNVKTESGTAVFARGDSYVVVRISKRDGVTLVSVTEFGFRRASAAASEGEGPP